MTELDAARADETTTEGDAVAPTSEPAATAPPEPAVAAVDAGGVAVDAQEAALDGPETTMEQVGEAPATDAASDDAVPTTTHPEATVESEASVEEPPDASAPADPVAPVDLEPVVEAGPRTVGRFVADALRSAGVRYAFTVPGESFLGLLDAFEGAGIRVVATRHRGSINARYLAPPTALVAVAVGLVGGLVWRPLWAIPAAYAAGIGIGGVAIARHQGPAVAVRVPGVLATMHGSWGWGFLTSRPDQLVPEGEEAW